MEKAEIERRVKELGKLTPIKRGLGGKTGWYQTYNLKGVITGFGKVSTIKTWDRMRSFLPINLRGVKILDLGCNAGMFSIMPALEGAQVVGIDGRQAFIDQAEFVKEVYEDDYSILDIKFVQGNICEYDLESLGKFDWIFAIAILRYLGVIGYGRPLYCEESIKIQTEIMERLAKMTGNIIIRSNGESFNTPEYYDKWMEQFGYVCGKRVQDVTERGILNSYHRSWGCD